MNTVSTNIFDCRAMYYYDGHVTANNITARIYAIIDNFVLNVITCNRISEKRDFNITFRFRFRGSAEMIFFSFLRLLKCVSRLKIIITVNQKRYYIII